MFAFDANRHEYVDLEVGDILPHITGMLQETGWIDDRWYTAESCERGTMVHRLTADYDLGAIDDPEAVTSKYKGWLLGHVQATRIIRPAWHRVEEPLVHSTLHFGGRPDRVGTIYGAQSVLEVKSGALEKAHAIQMALQAILVAPELRLPPESLQRFGLYLSARGKFKLHPFVARQDFDEARRIIKCCCSI